MTAHMWRLIGTDGQPYQSQTPGTFGGHRRGKVYGRLDCPSALRALERGGYRPDRVFFADAHTAVSAGYRPCAICLPRSYKLWRALQRAGPQRDTDPDDIAALGRGTPTDDPG
ncbi:MAG TPA: Ada metal-binding domain-containing protein [Mycobacteriales bacterium]|jgi:hypothetical protein|nr:Ada metal-binding domain-containing protein [Mycobacteriales bacterium]